MVENRDGFYQCKNQFCILLFGLKHFGFFIRENINFLIDSIITYISYEENLMKVFNVFFRVL